MERAADIITQNYPATSGSAAGLMVSQTIYFGLLGLRKGDVITNILVNNFTVGTTTTSFWVALYDTSGTRLAMSNDLTTALDATTGPRELALSSPYTILQDGGYFAAALTINGTPANCVSLARASSSTVSHLPVTGGARQWSAQTGQATPPASATYASTSFGFWFGVN